MKKYNRDILEIKKRAIDNCAKADLAVVLVPCVIPGSNDGQLWRIIQFAKERMPVIRGVHFQPVSYFGIYTGEERVRITIPRILRQLERQSDGEIKACHFLPGAYEHPACSFQGVYIKGEKGRLSPLNQRQARIPHPEDYHRIRNSAKRLWLPGKSNLLSIGGMAFQDAWNIDLLRVRRCSVQIIGKDGRMIPLCNKYLNDIYGNKIHPGIA